MSTRETPAQNIALFLDCENVGLSASEAQGVLQWVAERGSVVVRRAYADWFVHRRLHNELHTAAVELIDMPVDFRGKNRADIRLVVDAMEVALMRPNIDTFVIASGDSDFVPLLNRIREYGRYTIVLTRRDNGSGLLEPACDELVYLDQIVPLEPLGTSSPATPDSNAPQTPVEKPTPAKKKKEPQKPKEVVLPEPLLDRVFWAVRLLRETGCSVSEASKIQNELAILYPKFRLQQYGIPKSAGYRKLFTAMELEGLCQLDFTVAGKSKTWKITFLDRFLDHEPKLAKPATYEARLRAKRARQNLSFGPTTPNPHPLPSFAKPASNGNEPAAITAIGSAASSLPPSSTRREENDESVDAQDSPSRPAGTQEVARWQPLFSDLELDDIPF